MSHGKHAARLAEIKAFLSVYWLPVVLCTAAFYVAAQYIKPAPPREITFYTGTPDGAYYQEALRFKEALGELGITVYVVSTLGSRDNLARLRAAGDEEPVVAFVQSGSSDMVAPDGTPVPVPDEDGTPLVSLGSLFAEPVWLFSRMPMDSFADLKGKRVALGQPGSGTRAAASVLLEASRATEADGVDWVASTGLAALASMRVGRVDATFLVAAPEAPVVGRYLATPGLHLYDFRRAKAYSRHFRFLTTIEVPQGALDLSTNMPDHDLTLLAATSNLVVRDDLHPGMVDLLLLTARELYRQPTLVTEEGEFPTARFADPDLSETAKRFYEKGPSFLQRYLPFWAATWVDRLLVLLLPLLTVMIPLIRVMPPVYRWRVRKKIYRWYRTLMDIEARAMYDGLPAAQALEELQDLSDDLADINVPLSYADELYELKWHVRMVKDQIEALSHGLEAK